MKRFTVPGLLLLVAVAGCCDPPGPPDQVPVAAAQPVVSPPPPPADAPAAAPPVGQVGSKVPNVTVTSVDGNPISLAAVVGAKPTVLIFYRGNWCPYCNRHLGQLIELQPKLDELGYQILALSADSPTKLAETIDKQKINYTLLSDNDMRAAEAFGLAFRVDDATFDRYKNQFGLDLEAASGRTHHELPVPAAYVIDSTGTIRFAHSDPDYRVRIAPDELLAEAKKYAGQ